MSQTFSERNKRNMKYYILYGSIYVMLRIGKTTHGDISICGGYFRLQGIYWRASKVNLIWR